MEVQQIPRNLPQQSYIYNFKPYQKLNDNIKELHPRKYKHGNKDKDTIILSRE